MNITLELSEIFKGKCLVSMPNTKSDAFNQSVIYITEHSTVTGAVGVIINKNIPEPQNRLANFDFRQGNKWNNVPLYFGGPIEASTGFVLHHTLGGGLSLTGNKQKIQQLVDDELVTPLMLTAGYCIWDSFQLEKEVRFNNWLVLDGACEYLLNSVDPTERYREALLLAGIDNLALLDFTGSGNA